MSKSAEDYKNIATIYKLKAHKFKKRAEQLEDRIKELEQEVDQYIESGTQIGNKYNQSKHSKDKPQKNKEIKETIWQGNLDNNVFEQSQNLFSDVGNDFVMTQLQNQASKLGLTPEMVFRAVDIYYENQVKVDAFKSFLSDILKLQQNHITRIVFLCDENISGIITKQDYLHCLQAFGISEEMQQDSSSYYLTCLMEYVNFLFEKNITIIDSFDQIIKNQKVNSFSRQHLINYCYQMKSNMKNKDIIALYRHFDELQQNKVSKQQYLTIMNQAYQAMVFETLRPPKPVIDYSNIQIYRFLSHSDFIKEKEDKTKVYNERHQKNLIAFLTDDKSFGDKLQHLDPKNLIFQKLNIQQNLDKITLNRLVDQIKTANQIINKERINEIFQGFETGLYDKMYLLPEAHIDENEENKHNNQQQNTQNLTQSVEDSQEIDQTIMVKQQLGKNLKIHEEKYIQNIQLHKEFSHDLAQSPFHKLVRFQSGLQNQEYENREILKKMDSLHIDNETFNYQQLLPHLIYFSNLFAKIARSLNYNLSFLKITDFQINLSNYSNFLKSISQLGQVVFYIIYYRINISEQFYQQNYDNIGLETFETIFRIKWQIKNYLTIQSFEIPQSQSDHYMQQQNYQNINEPKKIADFQAIEEIVNIFIMYPDKYFKYDVIPIAQKLGVHRVCGFLGYTGNENNYINEFFQGKIIQQQNSIGQHKTDIRGVYTKGSCKNMFIAFHDISSEYDLNLNQYSSLIQPNQNFLPAFPDNWKINEGYGKIFQYTLETPQYIAKDPFYERKELAEKQMREEYERLYGKLSDQKHSIIDQNEQEKRIFEEMIKEEKIQDKMQKTHENFIETDFVQFFQKQLDFIDSIIFTGYQQGAALSQIAAIYLHFSLQKQNKPLIKLNLFESPNCFDQEASEQINTIYQQIEQERQDHIKQYYIIQHNSLLNNQQTFTNQYQPLQQVRNFYYMARNIFEIKVYQFIEEQLSNPKLQQAFLSSLGEQIYFQYSLNNIDDFIYNQFTLPMKSPYYKNNFSQYMIDMSKEEIPPEQQKIWDLIANNSAKDLILLIPNMVHSKIQIEQKQITGTVFRKLVYIISNLLYNKEDNVENVIFDSEFMFSELINEKLDIQPDNIKKLFLQKIKLTDITLSSFVKAIMKVRIQQILEQNIYFKQLSYFGGILDGILNFSCNYGTIGKQLIKMPNRPQEKKCYEEQENHLLQQINIVPTIQDGFHIDQIFDFAFVVKTFGVGEYYEKELHVDEQRQFRLKAEAIYNNYSNIPKLIKKQELFQVLQKRAIQRLKLIPILLEGCLKINTQNFDRTIYKKLSSINNLFNKAKFYNQGDIEELRLVCYFLSTLYKIIQIQYLDQEKLYDHYEEISKQYDKFILGIMEIFDKNKENNNNQQIIDYLEYHQQFVENGMQYLTNQNKENKEQIKIITQEEKDYFSLIE